jgi:hypothetical protein
MKQFYKLLGQSKNRIIQQLENLLNHLKPRPSSKKGIKHVNRTSIEIISVTEISREKVIQVSKRVLVQKPPLMKKHFQKDAGVYEG